MSCAALRGGCLRFEETDGIRWILSCREERRGGSGDSEPPRHVCYLLATVMPGQSSVRNGDAGSPSAL